MPDSARGYRIKYATGNVAVECIDLRRLVAIQILAVEERVRHLCGELHRRRHSGLAIMDAL